MIFATEVYGNDVFCYSRAKAIEEGELIDVAESARAAGFKLPVAVTHAAWIRCIEETEENENKQTLQDRKTKLKDMLRRLYFECRRNPWVSSFVFRLLMISNNGATKLAFVELKAVIGSDDNGEAVITVMLTDEGYSS